jgi:two-component system response regulator RegA
MDEGRTLLIVDDNEIFRDRLARAFSDRGFDVRKAQDYDSAVACARTESPEWAVVDLRMPGRNGLEVVRDLKESDGHTKIVVLTGYGSIATAIDAVRLGAINYLQKPADADDIIAAFSRGEQPPMSGSDHDYQAPSLARAEWEHIQRVFELCDRNVSETARRLNMHRRTLQRILAKRSPR